MIERIFVDSGFLRTAFYYEELATIILLHTVKFLTLRVHNTRFKCSLTKPWGSLEKLLENQHAFRANVM